MEVGKSGGNTPKKGLQDRFGAGMFFGMILGVLLIVPMYYAIYKLETERDPVAVKHPNYVLNSPEWKIDTLQEQPVDTSEDERIREEIKNFLDDICYLKASITPEDLDRDAISRWIAYLNRQSKEQPVYKEALTEYISKRLKELWDSSSAQDDHDAYYRNPTVKELKDIVNIIDSL